MLKMAVFKDHRRTDIVDIQHEQGNLFELVRKAEFYVLSNIRRRVGFDGGQQRVETPELPMEAVREVITNGFAHRSYRSNLAIQIEIYPDSVEVFNPGWFADGDSPEAHLEGRVKASTSENKLIVRTLFKSKDIEAFGTGMPRVRDFCERAGIRFAYEKTPFGTNFVFHRNDPFGQVAEDGRRENEPQAGPGGREQRIIHYLIEHGASKPKEMSEALDIPPRTLSRDLSGMLASGSIEAQGTTSGRTYVANLEPQ